MKRSGIQGWVEVSNEGLRVAFPRGEDYWAEVGLAFHNGRLGGLERAGSASTANVYRGRVEGAGMDCYFKEYLNRDALDPWKDMVRASRARRALLNERECSALGFHLPRSRCLIEKYRWGRLIFCALINEAIEDAPILREWLTNPDLGLAGSRLAKRALLNAFARELGAWHAKGLHHGDLRLGNVLCHRNDIGYTFYWLDNERNKKYKRLPTRLRVHNLMRINFEPCGVDATDRLRFWKAYLDTAQVDPAEKEKIRHAVIRKTTARRKKRGWA